jgi:hypothetical protein
VHVCVRSNDEGYVQGEGHVKSHVYLTVDF